MSISLLDLTCRFPDYTSRLFKCLSNKTNEVELFVAGYSQLHSNYFKEHEDIFVELSTLLGEHKRNNSFFRKGVKLIEYLINRSRFEKIVKKKKPDVIHFQFLPLLEFFKTYELQKFDEYKALGIKIVYTVHNVLPHNIEQKYKDVYQKVYQKSDKLIVHTKQAQRKLIEDFGIPEEKIELIPHGLLETNHKDKEKNEARKILKIKKDRELVLFFGGISPYKGLEFLIDTWNKVEQKEKKLLIIAGSGPKKYLNKLNYLIEDKNLSRSIETRFYFIPDEELSLLLDASDIVVYPYKKITQSGALFLGMGKGKPVITTKVGGFLEVIREGENGEMVEYGNAVEFAERINYLLQNDNYRKLLAENALKEMKEKYSWDLIAKKTLTVYNTLKNEN